MGTRSVRSGTVVTLAIVLGLLVAATGVFVTLYTNKQGDAERAAGELARTERTIDSRQDRLDSIESTMDELDSDRTRLEGENGRLHACADPAKDMIDAARSGDEAGFNAASADAIQNCGR